MLAMETLATALLAVAGVLCGVAAEAPFVPGGPGYQYPPPNGPNGPSLSTDLAGNTIFAPPASVINNGIAAAPVNTPTGPGYVDPVYQPRYNDFQDGDVHKHVYVHVAPDEPVERQAPLVVNARKPKKHYKIVFIKTPTVAPPAAAYVNVPQPDQEKTLIYVLTKKPDLKQSLVLSTPAPTQPAKPEVFFIRYKTNEVQGPSQVAYQGGQAVKPLSNSYGVPLGAPLGPNSLLAQQSNTVVTASTPGPAPQQPGTYNTL